MNRISVVLRIFLPLAAVILAAGGYVVFDLRNTALNEIKTRQSSLISLAATRSTGFLQQSINDLRFLTGHIGSYTRENGLQETDLPALIGEVAAFSAAKGFYDQIRFIDSAGFERIRVDYKNGQAAVIPTAKLQNKKNRYYFTDTISLESGGIFISPLDLNMERGEVEVPYKPMIRVGMPVESADGERHGIIVLNLLGQRVLDLLEQDAASNAEIMLLNADGHWLKGPIKEDVWAFMFGNGITLGDREPRVWAQVSATDQDQFEEAGKLWTYTKIYPLRADGPGSDTGAIHGEMSAQYTDYHWIALSAIPEEQLQKSLLQESLGPLVVCFVVLCMAFLGSILTGRALTARATADRENRSKSEFLASMSHELRTPMNGVIGMSEILSHSNLSKQDREVVETIRDSAHSLLGLIDDVLDFSKIEAGKLSIVSDEMDLENEFDRVVSLLAHSARSQKVTLRPFFDPNIPAQLCGDPLRVRQVLTNLLSNAIKFSSGLERTGTVLVQVENHGHHNGSDWVHITVSDNGIGMDQDTVARVFKPFEQAEAGTTRRYGGTGLGLAITHSLVSMMRGNVRVESTQGVGTRFTVELPFSSSKTAAEKRQIGDPDLSGATILLFAENQETQDWHRLYFENCNAQVVLCSFEKTLDLSSQDMVPDKTVLVLEGTHEEIQPVLHQLIPSHLPPHKVVWFRELAEQSDTVQPPSPSLFVEQQILSPPLSRRAYLRAIANRLDPATSEHDTERTPRLVRLGVTDTRSMASQERPLVLVAEDNQTNLDVIKRQLDMLGYEADLSENGADALEKWKVRDYAIVLTDIHMPEMDGYELTRQIRAMESQRHFQQKVPIIALTANALRGEAEKCLSLGMNHYLTKPIEMAELQTVLQNWITREPETRSSPTNRLMVQHEEKPTHEIDPREAEIDLQAIDPKMLEKVVGDDPELQATVVQNFFDEAVSLLSDLDEARLSREGETYVALAHKLKSSTRMVGGTGLGSLLEKLEEAGRGSDWEIIDRQGPSIKAGFETLRAFFEDNPIDPVIE